MVEKGNGPKVREQILAVMLPDQWMSPTQIGLALGIPYDRASGYVNRHLKQLVAEQRVSKRYHPKPMYCLYRRGAA